jgi:hypothetical protein
MKYINKRTEESPQHKVCRGRRQNFTKGYDSHQDNITISQYPNKTKGSTTNNDNS